MPEPTSTSSTGTLSIDQAMALAGSYYGDEKFLESIDLCGRVLAVKPGFPNAYALAAMAASGAGRASDADRLAGMATNAFILSARERSRDGKNDSAIKLLHKALMIDPSCLEAVSDLAQGLYNTGKGLDALLMFDRAAVISTEKSPYHAKVSELSVISGLWEMCLEATTAVLSTNPDQASTFFYIRALAHYNLDKPQEARADLREALRLAPDRAAYHVLSGHLSLDRGDVADALASYRSAQQLAPMRSDAHWGAALCSRLLGTATDTLTANAAFFERCLAEGSAAEASGNRSSAARSYVQALAARPDREDVARRLDTVLRAWREDLFDESVPIARRNPDWVLMESLAADARYREVLYNNPKWCGVPGGAAARTGTRKVWDGFMLSNEIDLLELRLKELDGVVDRFVIVESPWTHQGRPKELIFEKYRDRFSAYADRIVHVVAEERRGGVPWEQESYQRECIRLGLDRAGAKDDDLLILGDIDEFPRVEVIRRIVEDDDLSSRLVGLSYTIYAFFLNYKLYSPFIRPLTMPVGLGRALGLNLSRQLLVRTFPFPVPIIHDAGWHFTWLGGVDAVWTKLQNFCHLELLDGELTKESLREKFARGDFSILQMGVAGKFVPIDERFPATFRDHLDKLTDIGWCRPLNRRQGSGDVTAA